MVSTLDFESSDPSSNLGRTFSEDYYVEVIVTVRTREQLSIIYSNLKGLPVILWCFVDWLVWKSNLLLAMDKV